MRAKEFINEEKKGKLTPRQRFASRGIHVFSDTNYDRSYDLNRVMMAVASTDGVTTPEMDGESWNAKYNTGHPYTKIESDMLKLAYKAVGVPFKDLNKGDMRSQELPSTNKQSVINSFKGYEEK